MNTVLLSTYAVSYIIILALSVAVGWLLSAKTEPLAGKSGYIFAVGIGVHAFLALCGNTAIYTYYDRAWLFFLMYSHLLVWIAGVGLAHVFVPFFRSSIYRDKVHETQETNWPLVVLVVIGVAFLWALYPQVIYRQIITLWSGPSVAQGIVESVRSERNGSIAIIADHRYFVPDRRWSQRIVKQEISFVHDPFQVEAFLPDAIGFTVFGVLLIGVSLVLWSLTLLFVIWIFEIYIPKTKILNRGRF